MTLTRHYNQPSHCQTRSDQPTPSLLHLSSESHTAAQSFRGTLAVVAPFRQALITLLKPWVSPRRRLASTAAPSHGLGPLLSLYSDALVFENLSADGSSYSQLHGNNQAFTPITQRELGTHAFECSAQLIEQLSTLRESSGAELLIGSQLDALDHRAIDPPPVSHSHAPSKAQLRRFCQLSTLSSLMPATSVHLQPMDLYNILLFLRRRWAKAGRQSLRFYLRPGQAIEIEFTDFDKRIRCPRSLYHGSRAQCIELWGLAPLRGLTDLLPWASGIEIHLMGSGLPSTWQLNLGDNWRFSLSLSGQTERDFSQLSRLDLIQPATRVDTPTEQRIQQRLIEQRAESLVELSRGLALDQASIKAALHHQAQQGQLLSQYGSAVYRYRPLFTDPQAASPWQPWRFINPQELKAYHLNRTKRIRRLQASEDNGQVSWSGEALDGAHTYYPRIQFNQQQTLSAGQCTCPFYRQHKRQQGPCAHMLALSLLKPTEPAPATSTTA